MDSYQPVWERVDGCDWLYLGQIDYDYDYCLVENPVSGIPEVSDLRAITVGHRGRHLGLNDWLFDLDKESDIARIVPTVLELAKNPEAAKAKAAKAKAFVEQRQRDTMLQVAKSAGVLS